jgi:hypothetical protein
MLSFTISEFQTSLFMAALPIYWLKDLAKFNPKKRQVDQRVNVMQKLSRHSVGENSCMQAFLFVFYCILVIDFMTLYSLYYWRVQIDPGFSYTHVQELDKPIQIMLFISAGLLCFYYIWYFCAMCNNLRLIMVTDLSTKITFISSQIVHALMILAVMLGVFSRHFANGGIQLFFMGMINVYVITLCILNIPIRRKKIEAPAADVEMQASVSQDQPVRPDDIVLDLNEEE